MFVLDPMMNIQGQEESGWNAPAKGSCMKTVLMRRTWTTMANCAPYAKQIYSFVYGINCCQNKTHKKFLKLHVKDRLAL